MPWAIGSLLGGTAGVAAELPITAGLSSLEIPIAAAAVQLIHTIAVAWLLTERLSARGWDAARRTVGHAPTVVRDGLRQTLAAGNLRLLVTAELLWGFAIVAVETLRQPRVGDLVPNISGNTLLLGVIGATVFLGGAVGSAAVPMLMRLLRHRTAWVAIAGRLVQATGMAGLAGANGPLFYGTYLVTTITGISPVSIVESPHV